MEANEILDPLNKVHLLALQVVFIERINTALVDFIVYWNNHKLRTEHSQTPNQLWITGVEIDPNIRFLGETSNNVIIPRTPFKLTNDE